MDKEAVADLKSVMYGVNENKGFQDKVPVKVEENHIPELSLTEAEKNDRDRKDLSKHRVEIMSPKKTFFEPNWKKYVENEILASQSGFRSNKPIKLKQARVVFEEEKDTEFNITLDKLNKESSRNRYGFQDYAKDLLKEDVKRDQVIVGNNRGADNSGFGQGGYTAKEYIKKDDKKDLN